MTAYDSVIMVDWSGGNDTGAQPRKDAIWACRGVAGRTDEPVYLRNRIVAEDWLQAAIAGELDAGRRVLVGFDFPFGYPAGFAQALTGQGDPFAVWAYLARRISDAPKQNNRFDLAADINLSLGGGRGPFWANALGRDIAGLPRTKADYANPFPDRRAVEEQARGTFTCWQLAGAGAVGSQVLMGLPVLHRLRQRFAEALAVWPFEPLDCPVAFVEIWPSLMVGPAEQGWIKDAWQVAEVARMVSALMPDALHRMLDVSAPHEGWIFGLGHVAELQGNPEPPPLRNDCFALPQGMEWTPVDDALALLRSRMGPVTGTETLGVVHCDGRILAQDAVAVRAHPPQANTAVDGYGFKGGRPEGAHLLPLVDWRVAAGDRAAKAVPDGQAVRILTGAALPPGIDTVILQEDVNEQAGRIAFQGPIRAGANTRNAGEDVAAGGTLLQAGRRVSAADVGLMAATGLAQMRVRRPLRVGVLSTGDEIVPPGAPAHDGAVYDANRPMLLALIARLGHLPVDLGHVPDDRAALRSRLDSAQADAILTSGGASSGDEDHVSALLRATGSMALWRIAVKPGRPLALGLWNGVPVFGLPGNPVAAMVCTLVFARPALAVLAGEDWPEPQGFDVPAAFSKNKKPGRREYLRARMRNGQAEVFPSEGSGRISGLSWAEGLVELPDAGIRIAPGDPVRFIPWGGFGL